MWKSTTQNAKNRPHIRRTMKFRTIVYTKEKATAQMPCCRERLPYVPFFLGPLPPKSKTVAFFFLVCLAGSFKKLRTNKFLSYAKGKRRKKLKETSQQQWFFADRDNFWACSWAVPCKNGIHLCNAWHPACWSTLHINTRARFHSSIY